MCLMFRKSYTPESVKNRNTSRKDVHRRHDTTSDDSSSQLDERNRARARDNRHHHTKHSRHEKHAVKAAASQQKSSEKYTSKNSSDSRNDYPDQGHKTESKFRSTQTNKVSSADSKIYSESNREGTESRMKRKHSGNAEVHRRESKSRNPAVCADSENADSKEKQARTEVEQTALQSKTARHTVGTAFEDARARYLARKGKSSVPVVCEDSE